VSADERADRQDRAVTIIGWVTAAITAATLVLAAVTLPALLDARGSILAQQRSDEIARCRSELRADIDTATAVSDRAESERVDAIGDVIVASLEEDQAAVRSAALELAASKDRAGAARDGVDDANRAYERAVKLSGADPARFLAECAARS
jgi:hypothetical protein